jgi:hypothetical protein
MIYKIFIGLYHRTKMYTLSAWTKSRTIGLSEHKNAEVNVGPHCALILDAWPSTAARLTEEHRPGLSTKFYVIITETILRCSELGDFCMKPFCRVQIRHALSTVGGESFNKWLLFRQTGSHRPHAANAQRRQVVFSGGNSSKGRKKGKFSLVLN